MASKYQRKLIDEMESRGLREATIKKYVRTMYLFCTHFKKSPDKLGLPEIRSYHKYLRLEKKVSESTVNNAMSAIKFFYTHVMNIYFHESEIPRLKMRRKLPVVLTLGEIGRMIRSVNSPLYKAVILTMYSAGLRQSEVRNLKVSDVDRKHGVLIIRDDKNRRDRQAILSTITYKYLRYYWECCRLRHPFTSEYLFIGSKQGPKTKRENKGLSHSAVGHMVEKAAALAGIKKKYTLIY